MVLDNNKSFIINFWSCNFVFEFLMVMDVDYFYDLSGYILCNVLYKGDSSKRWLKELFIEYILFLNYYIYFENIKDWIKYGRMYL